MNTYSTSLCYVCSHDTHYHDYQYYQYYPTITNTTKPSLPVGLRKVVRRETAGAELTCLNATGGQCTVRTHENDSRGRPSGKEGHRHLWVAEIAI